VINIDKEDVEASPSLAGGDVESSFIRGVVKLGDRLLILLDVDRVLSDEERMDLGEMETEPASQSTEEE
jgi:purine-binding chemotaxis protein CheW